VTLAATPRGDRLRLVSHFPGRLRVRAETFRREPDVAKDVAARIEQEDGVTEVRIAPYTGSLLILYRPRELQLPRLVQTLVRAGGLRGIEVDDPDQWGQQTSHGWRVREAAGAWNRAVQRLTDGKVDMRTAVPGSLAATGIAMFLAGRRRVPEWYDLVFWAFVTFSNLNHPASAHRADGLPEDDGPTS
jgi:hypothetical protein